MWGAGHPAPHTRVLGRVLAEAQALLAWRAEHAERTLTDRFLYPAPEEERGR